jgi:hypothetical protein
VTHPGGSPKKRWGENEELRWKRTFNKAYCGLVEKSDGVVRSKLCDLLAWQKKGNTLPMQGQKNTCYFLGGK